MFTARPRIDINLDDLLYNLGQIRARIPNDTQIMAVVKDCAYGCGARPIARVLENAGVSFFAVARMNEALDLRKANIHSPILCLGNATEEEISWAALNSVHLAINDWSELKSKLLDSSRVNTLLLHMNVDTGMGRLGISINQLDETISLLKRNASSVVLEGVFTHFACADEPRTETVKKQSDLFQTALDKLTESGLTPRYIHSPNSAATLRFDIPSAQMIRPGIALYGCKPDPEQKFGIYLRPIASLKSEVVKIKRVSRGTPISYGAHYRAPGETSIATVALGYAHGLPRLLSNKGEVLINGKRYPIAGSVTMDYIMVDVGDSPVSVGDEVVAWGRQQGAEISPDEVARICSTIGYEILCGMSSCIDRHYWLDQQIIETTKGHLY